MKRIVLAGLIGGIAFGVVAALLYSAERQILISIGGLLAGVSAGYLHLWLRPPTSKSLYGSGALAGVLAGLCGGVAMTLVVMATGETEAAPGSSAIATFALHLGVMVIVYVIFAPLGALLGVVAFQTHLATDNSRISKVLAVAGSALVLGGTFLPIAALPFVGSRSLAFFIYDVHWLGLLAPSMAVLSIALVKFNRVKWCCVSGLVCTFGILYPFVFLQHSLGGGALNPELTAELVVESGQYGGLVMGGGALLLLVAAARAALPMR